MDGALSEEDKRKLVAASMEAKKRSYSPYSKYAVGAALLTTDGTVFTGRLGHLARQRLHGSCGLGWA